MIFNGAYSIEPPYGMTAIGYAKLVISYEAHSCLIEIPIIFFDFLIFDSESLELSYI